MVKLTVALRSSQESVTVPTRLVASGVATILKVAVGIVKFSASQLLIEFKSEVNVSVEEPLASKACGRSNEPVPSVITTVAV